MPAIIYIVLKNLSYVLTSLSLTLKRTLPHQLSPRDIRNKMSFMSWTSALHRSRGRTFVKTMEVFTPTGMKKIPW